MKNIFGVPQTGHQSVFRFAGMLAVLSAVLVSSSVATAGETTQLVVKVLQDEAMRLPEDNTALFNARSPGIRLSVQYLADAGTPSETQLTLVTPTGQEEDLIADADGNFSIPNPISGLYAVVARTATSAIASIPFYARQVDVGDELVGQVAESDNTVQLPVIPEGRGVVEQLAEQYVSYTDPNEEEIDPVRYDFETDELHGYQVRLTGDDRVLGRVIIASESARNRGLLADNNLFLLRNGVRMQNVISDASGDFVFSDMTPGVYGLVAAGPAGYTAFSFEVLPSNAFTQNENEASEISAAGFVLNKTKAPTSVLPVVMIPPELVPKVLEIQRRGFTDAATAFPADGISTPLAGGGAAGGGPAGFGGGGFSGGGFGGGGGGFGGLGELLGLAGIGVALAASDVFDDDDDVFEPVPSVSPFLP